MTAALALAAALCAVSTPVFDPKTERADAIVVGRAITEPADALVTMTRIQIVRTLAGRFQDRLYDLQWHVGGSGMCEPRGPKVLKGQTVVIYFSGRPGALRPLRWLRVEDARRIDPFVAAALVR